MRYLGADGEVRRRFSNVYLDLQGGSTVLSQSRRWACHSSHKVLPGYDYYY